MLEIFVESVANLELVYGKDATLSNKENISLLGRKFLIQKLKEQGLSFDFHISLEEKGKPFFTHNSNIHFSVSNTQKFIAIILSDKKVGIDIEQTRKYNDSLIKRFFNKEEIIYLKNQNDYDKNKAFTQLWTIKESFVKMTGTGIANNFNNQNLKPINSIFTLSQQYTKLSAKINSFYIEEKDLFVSYAVQI